jgi:hypothetical protein
MGRVIERKNAKVAIRVWCVRCSVIRAFGLFINITPNWTPAHESRGTSIASCSPSTLSSSTPWESNPALLLLIDFIDLSFDRGAVLSESRHAASLSSSQTCCHDAQPDLFSQFLPACRCRALDVPHEKRSAGVTTAELRQAQAAGRSGAQAVRARQTRQTVEH